MSSPTRSAMHYSLNLGVSEEAVALLCYQTKKWIGSF